MKRLFDIIVSIVLLTLTLPAMIIACILIFLQDFSNPFYIAKRIGKDEKEFNMIKLRSMIINADKSGVDSTSEDDKRLTFIGRFIRKFKLDEITQLYNVIKGDMSIVGPRPNVKSGVILYTDIEKNLLKVRPGITDFSSIVFSDEGKILKGSKNPDLDYNQLIRPWKSRLGLIYINNQSFFIDICLIVLTAISIFRKQLALKYIKKLLVKLNTEENIVAVSERNNQLRPYPPPGSDKIYFER